MCVCICTLVSLVKLCYLYYNIIQYYPHTKYKYLTFATKQIIVFSLFVICFHLVLPQMCTRFVILQLFNKIDQIYFCFFNLRMLGWWVGLCVFAPAVFLPDQLVYYPWFFSQSYTNDGIAPAGSPLVAFNHPLFLQI